MTRPYYELTIYIKEQHMNKAELIEEIRRAGAGMNGVEEAHVTKKTAEAWLDAVCLVIGEGLVAGNEVTLPGIGKLSTKHKSARPGRNPKTGEEIEIPAKTVPHFSAAKALKDAVA